MVSNISESNDIFVDYVRAFLSYLYLLVWFTGCGLKTISVSFSGYTVCHFSMDQIDQTKNCIVLEKICSHGIDVTVPK